MKLIKQSLSVQDGNLKWDKDRLEEAIVKLPNGIYEIVIAKVYSKETAKLMRWYRGWLLPAVARHESEPDLNKKHNELLERYAPRIFYGDKMGESLRTSKMDTAQFTYFIQQMRNDKLSEDYIINLFHPNELETHEIYEFF